MNEPDRALRVLIEENERMKRFGFVKTELERTKKEWMRNI
jgi:hypothetical protein